MLIWAPAGTKYKLVEHAGYPGMIGAMFWTIDTDRRGSYYFSNVVGPQFHNYPVTEMAEEENAKR